MFAFVEDDKFKVFLSWSGEPSKQVALAWLGLLQEVIDGVQPFMSEENIGAGERSLLKIASELDGTLFGIVVVTRDNQNSQWLNFEAGALSRDFSDPRVRVAPCLVDSARKADVTGPLAQFHINFLDKKGVANIVDEIAKAVGADQSTVKEQLALAWPKYRKLFNAAKKLTGAIEHPDLKRVPVQKIDIKDVQLLKPRPDDPLYLVSGQVTLPKGRVKVWLFREDVAQQRGKFTLSGVGPATTDNDSNWEQSIVMWPGEFYIHAVVTTEGNEPFYDWAINAREAALKIVQEQPRHV
jgi:hypothetical protein